MMPIACFFILTLQVFFTGNQPRHSAEVIALSNAYRISQELDTFITNDTLSDFALEHSKNMATGKASFGHKGFNKRLKRGSRYFIINGFAENVFYCDAGCDAKMAIETWLDSREHKNNLQSDYTHIGVGVYQDKNGRNYFTQILARIEPKKDSK